MSLRISVGLNKKLGLPNYGSVGASCNVEFDVDASLFHDDLEVFHARVSSAYVACRQAVHDELARHRPAPGSATDDTSANGDEVPAEDNTGGHNGHDFGDDGNGRHRATQKQLDFIHQLARQTQGLGLRRLESLAETMFSRPVADLSRLDASCLIDCLKNIKTREIDIDNMLSQTTDEH